jgi:hypothetical protein
VEKADISETMKNQHVIQRLAKINANAVAMIVMVKNHADVAAIAAIVMECLKGIAATNLPLS